MMLQQALTEGSRLKEMAEKLIRKASHNNRSLALMKTFGLTKSEWEFSSRKIPIRVLLHLIALCGSFGIKCDHDFYKIDHQFFFAFAII